MVEVRAVATDAVIVIDGKVILLERNHSPDEGHWVLPGGLVERDETAREACIREVEEEVGLEVTVERFVGFYDDPNRDERGNVSAAFRCAPVGDARPVPMEEAREVRAFDPTELPETGFDHARIVADAVSERLFRGSYSIRPGGRRDPIPSPNRSESPSPRVRRYPRRGTGTGRSSGGSRGGERGWPRAGRTVEDPIGYSNTEKRDGRRRSPASEGHGRM